MLFITDTENKYLRYSGVEFAIHTILIVGAAYNTVKQKII